MNKLVKLSFGVLCFFIIFFIVDNSHTALHEQTHARIFDSYGINSTIHINYFHVFTRDNIAGYTHAENYKNKCNETCMSLNSQLEIASINTDIIMMTIILVGFLLWVYFFVVPK